MNSNLLPRGNRRVRVGSLMGWPLAGLVLGLGGLMTGTHAEITYRAGVVLPATGGVHELIGDLVPAGDGAAGVFSAPGAGHLKLRFHRFGPDAEILAEREHSIEPLSFYGPALAWDGARAAVVASTFTQSVWLRLSADGDLLEGPLQLPGLPSGAAAGRTAAFRVLWLGDGYAVFGLWLERQFPQQDLSAGNFYTHLFYWRVNAAGEPEAPRELLRLAPMTYPGIEGAERVYYDVVWTGAHFFLAYYAESRTGPPLSVYYRLFDRAGNEVRGESPLFAQQVAQGPRLAWNGQTVGATALKTVSMPHPQAGNYMYFRAFGPDGTPLGEELEYGQKLGFGPTVVWTGDRFLTVYCMMHDFNTLGYALYLNAFGRTGERVGTEHPLRNPGGGVMLGRMALAFDLALAANGPVLFGKAQTSDAWNIQNQTLVFTLNNDAVIPPVLTVVRDGDRLRFTWPASAAGFRLQHSPGIAHPLWANVVDPVQVVGDRRRVEWRLPDGAPAGFFRLVE